MPKINKRFIDREVVRPTTGQVIYRDSELVGFGLRVTRGSMAYIAECRVNGKNRRVTFGMAARMTPDAARKAAKTLLAAMSNGHHPKEEQRQRKLKRITLGEVLDDYIGHRLIICDSFMF